ncbi:MAG: ABC transporter ATP-binding protein [Kyrpidia sp.]|nr:ABC transporter ATP-binding protein [Kyrpidia sp.]
MVQAAVEVDGIWKSYGERQVLQNVSFSVSPGMVMGVIGPNGSGKSTLVRLLSGVDRPDRGTVLLDGLPVNAYPRRVLARRMAVLPQTPLVPFAFSVYDTVMMGRHPHLKPLRGETARDRRVVERILAETGLTELAGMRVDRLSGGQRQLVALAMVLTQEPDVLVLDEPTTFLDLGHQARMLDFLRRQRVRPLAVVMVLHDLNLAALYADRILLLNRGRVEALGSAADVLTEDHIDAVYGVRPLVVRHPDTGVPQILLQPGGTEAGPATSPRPAGHCLPVSPR